MVNYTAQCGFGQWWVRSEKTGRLIAMCTDEGDCRDIVDAMNKWTARRRAKGG